MSFALLASRNIRRNRTRTLLTILALAVSLAAFAVMRTAVAAYTRSSSRGAADRLVITRADSTLVPFKHVAHVQAAKGISAVHYGRIVNGRSPRKPSLPIGAVALDVRSLTAVYEEIIIEPSDYAAWLANRQGVILGETLAGKLGLNRGDTMVFKTRDHEFALEVTGFYTAAEGSFGTSLALFHYELYDQALPPKDQGLLNRIVVRVDSGENAAAVAEHLGESLRKTAHGLKVQTERDAQLDAVGRFKPIVRAIDFGSVVIILIVLLIVSNTMAISARERRYELAVLRAVGFRSARVSSALLAEAALVGAIGGALGVALAYVLVDIAFPTFLRNLLAVDTWTLNAEMGAITGLAGVVISLVAAAVPTWQAISLPVANALRDPG